MPEIRSLSDLSSRDSEGEGFAPRETPFGSLSGSKTESLGRGDGCKGQGIDIMNSGVSRSLSKEKEREEPNSRRGPQE